MNHNPVPDTRPTRLRLGGRRAVALVASAGLAVSLAACTGGQQNTASNEPASTEIPTDPVELSLWTVQIGPAQEALQNLIDEYEELHPNVTINLEYTESAAFSDTFKLRMSEQDAPDLIECSQGNYMGPLVEAGLIISLEPYDELYGWSDRIAEGFLGPSRMSDDGRSLGAGQLYGLPFAGQLTGLYYNREKVEELGIDTDFETIDEFTAALDTAKEAGETGLMFGNLDGDPGKNVWEQVLSGYEDKQIQREFVQGKEGTDLVTDKAIESVEQYQDWGNQGYFYDGVEGTSRADGYALFTGGEGVFALDGNYVHGTYSEAMGDNLGFTLFPRENAADDPQANGATEKPYCISSMSENPDVAANFLDFIAQEDKAQVLWDGGFVPLLGADSVVSDLPADEELLAAWQTLSDVDGMTYHLGWATPSFQSIEMPNLQEVLANRMEPEAFVESLQQNWEEFYGAAR
ncbi:extracellular solute-binding protein [Agromyces tropicus]|uniref:Extracellular solute-binding protein n=1 Tax=Agromyces tropicus TaxID=555371 RepID=A0ABP5GC03_9MICO